MRGVVLIAGLAVWLGVVAAGCFGVAAAETPGRGLVDAASPETASPETASPETASPETASRDAASPETAPREGASPDASSSDAASREGAGRDGALWDAEAIGRRVLPAALVVTAERPGAEPAQGSGCFVSGDGFAVTAAHLVRGAKRVEGRADGGETFTLRVVAAGEDCDIALLLASRKPKAWAEIGNARQLDAGSRLACVSTPRGLDFTLVEGIVANPKRLLAGCWVIQTTLPLAPGSSGGPVFDAQGRLAGLATAQMRDVPQATLVAPVNGVYELLAEHGVTVPAKPRQEAPGAQPATSAVREAVRLYNRAVDARVPARRAALYEAAAKAWPEFYEAWFNLGVTRRELARLEEAAKAFERASALRPQAVAPYRALGRVRMDQGRYRKAVTALEEAVRLAPRSGGAYNDLGEAYRRLERWEDALEQFERAAELDPELAGARYNAALSHLARGDRRRAVEELRAYVRLAPEASDADRVRRWIDRLEAGR